MILLLTVPHLNDLNEFYHINQDKEFQKEFTHLKNLSLEDTKENLKDIIDKNKKGGIFDFAFIKIAKQANQDNYYDSTNSKMIGFITYDSTSLMDRMVSGARTMLRYGIIKEYRNRGLMKMALGLRLKKYEEWGYNLVFAVVSHTNTYSERVLNANGFSLVRDDIKKTYIKEFK